VVTRLTVAAGVVVDAGQQDVWNLVVDWARQREWILATRTDGGHGLGARVVGSTGVGPIGFSDPMVITEWAPPARCEVTHEGRVVRGSGLFEVVPRGVGSSARSEFRWTERIELPLPASIGKPLAKALVGPLARLGLGWSLRRFARLAGHDARSAARASLP
jgi:Polyketide cyclase / dehydrase and lipid transport